MWVEIKNPSSSHWNFRGTIKSGKVWSSRNGLLVLQGNDGKWYKWVPKK